MKNVKRSLEVQLSVTRRRRRRRSLCRRRRRRRARFLTRLDQHAVAHSPCPSARSQMSTYAGFLHHEFLPPSFVAESPRARPSVGPPRVLCLPLSVDAELLSVCCTARCLVFLLLYYGSIIIEDPKSTES